MPIRFKYVQVWWLCNWKIAKMQEMPFGQPHHVPVCVCRKRLHMLLVQQNRKIFYHYDMLTLLLWLLLLLPIENPAVDIYYRSRSTSVIDDRFMTILSIVCASIYKIMIQSNIELLSRPAKKSTALKATLVLLTNVHCSSFALRWKLFEYTNEWEKKDVGILLFVRHLQCTHM